MNLSRFCSPVEVRRQNPFCLQQQQQLSAASFSSIFGCEPFSHVFHFIIKPNSPSTAVFTAVCQSPASTKTCRMEIILSYYTKFQKPPDLHRWCSVNTRQTLSAQQLQWRCQCKKGFTSFQINLGSLGFWRLNNAPDELCGAIVCFLFSLQLLQFVQQFFREAPELFCGLWRLHLN